MKVFSLWWLWSPPFSFFSTSFVTPSQLYPLSNVDLCSTKINHRNKCRTQIIHLNELLSVTHKSMFELKYKLSVNSVLHNLEICQIQLIYYVLDKVWLEFYLMLSATSIRLLNTNFDCFQVWYGSKVLSQTVTDFWDHYYVKTKLWKIPRSSLNLYSPHEDVYSLYRSWVFITNITNSGYVRL